MVHVVVCVYVWLCTYTFVQISTSAFRTVDTNPQVYVHYNHTRKIQQFIGDCN